MTTLIPATRTELDTRHSFPQVTPMTATLPTPVDLDGAKFAYTTRFVAELLDRSRIRLESGAGVVPRAGDVVLAEVVEIGQHTRLESPAGRRQSLYPGDRIVVAYGDRYAPDQFEAIVPEDLDQTDLVAAGGVTGRVVGQHATMADPTRLRPVGLLNDDGGRVTLARFAPHALGPWPTDSRAAGDPRTVSDPRTAGDSRTIQPMVVLALGSTMNSGKSTTAACLVRGLSQAGLRVHAGKATGTGAGRDPGLFVDAGAAQVLDFTDFGHPSTSRLAAAEVAALTGSLLGALLDDRVARPDVVVVEIADGLLQTETAALLRDPRLLAITDAVVFASAESLGARHGHDLLVALGYRVAAVSGVVTASPLAAREAAAGLPVPVIHTFDLALPEVALGVLGEPEVALGVLEQP